MNMESKSARENNSYLLFVFFLYFFISKDYLEHNLPLLGFADELIVLFSVPIFILHIRNQNLKLRIEKDGYVKYVVLFLMIGLWSSFRFFYQDIFSTVIPDAFLCIKFWLALYLGKYIFRNLSLEKFANKIFRHIKIISSLYLLLIILDWIFHIFRADIRYGLRSTQLMYSHPTVFASCCTLLIMILISIRQQITGYLRWLALLLIMLCSTLRSKAFGVAFVIFLICYFVFYRKKKIRVRTFLIFVPLVILLGWEQIEFYFFSSIQSGSARYQLLVNAFRIANDHFPFGAGFGTYASHYSGVNYSPVYSMYGISNIHGLQEGNASFISDSFWPMILGQTGYIGLAMFVLAIIFLFLKIQKLKPINISFYAAALCGLVHLLITSAAESAFVNPMAIPIAIWMGVLISKIINISID